MDDMMKYYQAQLPVQALYPYYFDRDIHMINKLGYANEREIHRDMQNHNQTPSHPLMYAVGLT